MSTARGIAAIAVVFSPLSASAQQAVKLPPLVAAPPPAATCAGGFRADGAPFHVSQSTGHDQLWCQVSTGPGVNVFAYSTGLEIIARFFDEDLAPLAPDFQVNTTLDDSTQDEPAVCVGTTGNVLFAWSDRNGYDGELMGIFGRLYDSAANPLGPEFQINQAGATSQWRPLIAARPDGGFVVAWSGDWDGDAFMRFFSASGAPLTGDILVNDFPWDAQVDPAPAVNAAGDVFVSFVDFSSHDPSADGLNLYGRTYAADGTPYQVEEFLVTSWQHDGAQSEPRVAAGADGSFLVVYEDEFGDGSGRSLFARRFDALGNALGPEFQVNEQTAGHQIRCSVAADASGEFLVAWEDHSQGPPRVVARRFDADAIAIGVELVVDAHALGRTRPVVAAKPDARGWVIAFDGFAGGFDASDVWARAYTDDGPSTFCVGKVNSAGCLPHVSFAGEPSASDPTPFWITASDVRNAKYGLLMYGFDGGATPFMGGTLCVGTFLGRTPTQFSGGGGGITCLGTFAFDFNAWIQGPASRILIPGSTVAAQYYYRDPPDPFGVGLTNAVRFQICP